MGALGRSSSTAEEVGSVPGGSPASPVGGDGPVSEMPRLCQDSVASAGEEAAVVVELLVDAGKIVAVAGIAERKLSWEG